MKFFQSNTLIFSILLLLASPLFSQKKDKKWDVSQPDSTGGVAYREENFTVTEGTWMNLDVSPDGQFIVFDLLGDIWKIPIAGGSATCLRSGLAWEVQPRFSPDGQRILFTSDAGGGDNIWMMQADGSKPKQITKESFRLLNNGEWIDNQYIVARKHFTSGRSLGAGEMWMYHISGGDGIQLTKRKNDQQDVNEPAVSPDGRYVYFSEDLYPGGFFQYNKNPMAQIFGIRRYDRETGKIEEVTGGSGGACRPQISQDGEWLAFVRRVETKTTLFVRNLKSGLEYPIFDGLDKDQQEAWTVFGAYPGFDWGTKMQTRAGEMQRIFIWAGGKINQVAFNFTKIAPDDRNTQGDEPTVSVSQIPFSCAVKTKLAETLKFENKVFSEKFTARAIRSAVTSPDGKSLVFNAAGQLYLKNLPARPDDPVGRAGEPKLLLKNGWRMAAGKKTDDLTALKIASEPAFSPDGSEIIFTVWDDLEKGKISKINLKTNEVKDLTTEKGIYRKPKFSPDGKMIIFTMQDGDDEMGPAMVEKTGHFTMNSDGTGKKFIINEGENPRFSADGKRVLVNTGGYLFGGLDKQLVSFDLNGLDKKVLFKSKFINQWSPSPDGKWLAFTELHKAYVCEMPSNGQPIDLAADMKSIPVSQISKDAGYNLHWSGDSKKVHFTLGEEYFSIDLTDRFDFLPGAPDSLPKLPESGLKIGLELESDLPTGNLVLENARIITCENNLVVEKGVVAIEKNKIVFVGSQSEYQAARFKISNPKIVDCAGKTIIPGIVDVHSHSGNFRFGLNPQKQWEYFANLAFGVTTMHDPSVNSEMAFSNAEMLRSGRMTGPRLFSTGTILYGAEGDFKAPINSLDDARSTLKRTKAWGAFSVKSYNQPRREQRQQIIAAARELNMLVVPEGGSFFYHNLNQVADGHTGIEHNIPVAILYDDVLQFWAKTKAHNTPTLIVNYGGVNGEYYWYQHSDVWKNERLRAFTPHHILDERARHRTMLPDEEYENGYILVSKTLKKMQDRGININLGSHGQLQGLGAHWELWMLQQGGMTNQQALNCATINGAKYLGMEKEIGSLAVGKLADLVILDANPLENIQNSEKISMVMVNGRLFDSKTMNEIGNFDKKLGKFWFQMPGANAAGATFNHSCTEGKCVCGH